MCNSVIIEIDTKEIECRRIIMQSIDNALKKGDEVFNRLSNKTDYLESNYKKFKDSLKNIDHKNLKK